MKDLRSRKPIDHYVEDYSYFHEELFLKLIPPQSTYLVYTICRIYKKERLTFEVMSQMVTYLLQYLAITNLPAFPICKGEYLSNLYTDSLLVLLLDMDVVEPPDILQIKSWMPAENWKQAIEDIWNAYNHRHGNVKSLVTLCIHCSRNPMKSLDKNSFHSLPVPSRIRDLLMLRNVAGILCEAWRIWPKCLPIEDIVNEAL